MKINQKYKILPHLIIFRIPGFLNHFKVRVYALSVTQKSSERQFYDLLDRLLYAIENKVYLPVIRLSDGEYNFILNDQPPVFRNISVPRYCIKYMLYLRNITFRKYEASTKSGVSSGSYSKEQRDAALSLYSEQLALIAGKGILALHLTFGQLPFQEKFHPALSIWLDKNKIVLSEKNFTHFYFVYALLRGSTACRIFQNRHVLVVHSATGLKQKKIKEALLNLGCRQVSWCLISENNSLHDKIRIGFETDLDLVLVGAGIGKPNIFLQLEVLSIPVVDAGYTFEVWADDSCKWSRAMMVPDVDWEDNKINFL